MLRARFINQYLLCISFLLVLSLPLGGLSQRTGLDLLHNKTKVEIPFELYNGLILVKLKMNGVNLNFLYDTGAENTILFKKEIAIVLGLKSSRRVRLVGANLDNFVYGFIVHNVHFQFQPNVARMENIIVLEENIFDLQQVLGLHIDGLIGGSFFRSAGIKIDYKNQVLSIYHPEKNRMDLSSFTEMPVFFKDQKPYISALVDKYDGTRQAVRLLVDTGSSIPLILHANVDSSLIAADHLVMGHIGVGISGVLIGTVGIVKKIDLNGFVFEEVITSLQNFDYLDNDQISLTRHGIVGNEVLSRFTVYIDYSKNKLYLKPGKKLKKKFEYDKSGLILSAVGMDFNQYIIQAVVPGSPAERLGIQAGDEILSVNFLPVSILTLQNIQSILKRRAGTLVRLKISRKGEKQRIDLILEDMLARSKTNV